MRRQPGHRHGPSQPAPPGGGELPFWSLIPLRPILIALAVFAVVAGTYLIGRAIGHKSVQLSTQLSDELADTNLAGRVTRELEHGEDEAELASKYAGCVKDANLGHFTRMLESGAPTSRRTAILLIGAGQETNIAPVLAAARAQDATAAAIGSDTLAAIGPRRLVELSNHQDEKVRRGAADALALLFDLDPSNAKVARLAQAMPSARKIRLLNEVCRPWPELLGTFVVTVNQVPSPFTVQIEQIGKTFYLKLGQAEFVTARGTRQFTIPIYRWCTITGSAVDAGAVRELLGGSVSITSTTGASWQGQITVTARRQIQGPLPGFLPFEPPTPGQTISAPLTLDRPSRPG